MAFRQKTISPLAFALLVATATVFGTASQAQAGGADGGGHGGKGVLCGGKLRPLDLYEAEAVYHLSLPQGEPDLSSALEAHLKNLMDYTGYSFVAEPKGWDLSRTPTRGPYEEELNSAKLKSLILDHFEDIPAGQHLPLTSDATLPKIPRGCQIVQILRIEGAGRQDAGSFGWEGAPKRISRDLGYWKMLSPRDQAAMILHELLYDIKGLHARPNSDDIRRMIGLVFSDKKLTPQWSKLDEVFKSGIFASFGCVSENEESAFMVVREKRGGKEGIGIYFDRINGTNPLFLTSAFVPGVTVKDANTAKNLAVRTKAKSEITGKSFDVDLHFHNEDAAAHANVDHARSIRTDPQNVKGTSDISLRVSGAGQKPAEFSNGECDALPWDQGFDDKGRWIHPPDGSDAMPSAGVSQPNEDTGPKQKHTSPAL